MMGLSLTKILILLIYNQILVYGVTQTQDSIVFEPQIVSTLSRYSFTISLDQLNCNLLIYFPEAITPISDQLQISFPMLSKSQAPYTIEYDENKKILKILNINDHPQRITIKAANIMNPPSIKPTDPFLFQILCPSKPPVLRQQAGITAVAGEVSDKTNWIKAYYLPFSSTYIIDIAFLNPYQIMEQGSISIQFPTDSNLNPESVQSSCQIAIVLDEFEETECSIKYIEQYDKIYVSIKVISTITAKKTIKLRIKNKNSYENITKRTVDYDIVVRSFDSYGYAIASVTGLYFHGQQTYSSLDIQANQKLEQELFSANVFPLPYTLLTIFSIMLCVMSKVLYRQTQLIGALYSLVSIWQVPTYFTFTFIFWNDYQPWIKILLLTSIAWMYVINFLAYCLQIYFLKGDAAFHQWVEKQKKNYYCYCMISVVGLLLSHKTKNIIFSKLFGFGIFRAKLDSLQKFRQFNYLVVINIVPQVYLCTATILVFIGPSQTDQYRMFLIDSALLPVVWIILQFLIWNQKPDFSKETKYKVSTNHYITQAQLLKLEKQKREPNNGNNKEEPEKKKGNYFLKMNEMVSQPEKQGRC